MASGVTVSSVELGGAGSSLQPVGNPRNAAPAEPPISLRSTTLCNPLGTPLVWDFEGAVGDPGSLLTVREVARALRIATSTVYKLCAEGKLVHVRISNAIRIPVTEVRRLVGAI